MPERTLRRAAGEGLVRGRRTTPRRFETTLREEAYLRRQWPLLRALRDALRTEPNVRLALLFGSQATGENTRRSDVDLLVELADSSAARVAQLTGRIERRIELPVQLVRIEDARRSPLLMATALEQGRVLVDRERAWPQLHAEAPRWRSRAEALVPLERAVSDLTIE